VFWIAVSMSDVVAFWGRFESRFARAVLLIEKSGEPANVLWVALAMNCDASVHC
jgi:hypothetical protein